MPEELQIKYLINPGWIRSRSDGDLHYIDARALVRLYGVPSGQWRLLKPDKDKGTTLPILGPRTDGRYTPVGQ